MTVSSVWNNIRISQVLQNKIKKRTESAVTIVLFSNIIFALFCSQSSKLFKYFFLKNFWPMSAPNALQMADANPSTLPLT